MAPEQPTSLWRHSAFTRLWAAQTVSQLGSQVSLLAIPLVGAELLHLDAFQFALLGTFEFLPFLLFSLPIGALADRLSRRPLLIGADLGRAAILATVPASFALGHLGLAQLYAVAFFGGVLTVVFEVAYLSYLPELVGRDQIIDANAKLEVSRSGSQIAGPGLAGALIGAIGAPAAIVADCASFVASAGVVLGIPRRERTPRPAEGDRKVGTSVRAEITEGIRYVLSHPLLRPIAACTGISNLCSSIVFAILILHFVRDLGLSAELIGLVFAVGNVGLLLGALSGARLGKRLGIGPAVIGAAILFGPSLLLVAAAPAGGPFAVAAITAGLFVGSISQVVYNVNQVSLRQAVTPPAMLGRMNATMRFIVWGTIPIGQLLGGALGTALGLGPAIMLGAVGSVTGFMPLVALPLRRLYELPETTADVPGSTTE